MQLASLLQLTGAGADARHLQSVTQQVSQANSEILSLTTQLRSAQSELVSCCCIDVTTGLHWMHEMQSAMANVFSQSVSVPVMHPCPAKMDESIEVPFWVATGDFWHPGFNPPRQQWRCLTVFQLHTVTVAPVRGNGTRKPLICIFVVKSKRCPTLLTFVLWQS